MESFCISAKDGCDKMCVVNRIVRAYWAIDKLKRVWASPMMSRPRDLKLWLSWSHVMSVIPACRHSSIDVSGTYIRLTASFDTILTGIRKVEDVQQNQWTPRSDTWRVREWERKHLLTPHGCRHWRWLQTGSARGELSMSYMTQWHICDPRSVKQYIFGQCMQYNK